MTRKKGQQARVTRADVAERAGTSPTTVAYVMNDTPGVKIREETRAKVLDAAKALGYTPSFTARSMKRGRTELIGLLLPSLDSQFHPFYAQMLHGVFEAAAETNYHFILLTQEREAKYRHCLRQNYLDGVIVVQSADEPRHLKRVLEHGLPVVALNNLQPVSAPQITMDYEGAMEAAIAALLERKARKILFVHGSWSNQPIARYRQVFNEHKERRRRPKVTFAELGIDRYQLSPGQIADLLRDDWDGLIIDGYELARDITHHVDYREQPERAMVVFSETAHATPLGANVTILQSQPEQTGRLAWKQLTAQLEGKKTRKTIYRYPFQTTPNPTKENE